MVKFYKMNPSIDWGNGTYNETQNSMHLLVGNNRRCDCCSTVEEWDSMILDGINSRVGKSDTLYILEQK